VRWWLRSRVTARGTTGISAGGLGRPLEDVACSAAPLFPDPAPSGLLRRVGPEGAESAWDLAMGAVSPALALALACRGLPAATPRALEAPLEFGHPAQGPLAKGLKEARRATFDRICARRNPHAGRERDQGHPRAWAPFPVRGSPRQKREDRQFERRPLKPCAELASTGVAPSSSVCPFSRRGTQSRYFQPQRQPKNTATQ